VASIAKAINVHTSKKHSGKSRGFKGFLDFVLGCVGCVLRSRIALREEATKVAALPRASFWWELTCTRRALQRWVGQGLSSQLSSNRTKNAESTVGWGVGQGDSAKRCSRRETYNFTRGLSDAIAIFSAGNETPTASFVCTRARERKERNRKETERPGGNRRWGTRAYVGVCGCVRATDRKEPEKSERRHVICMNARARAAKRRKRVVRSKY